MNPIGPALVIVVYSIAFLTAYLIKLKYNIVHDKSRNENIDGLRGFLALGVFIHHSAVWFKFIKTGIWTSPNSNLFNQFGQASVSFFFMITSYLFVTKLMDAKNTDFDWRKFFISRFFRLMPMYALSIFVVIFIILILSDWKVRVSNVSFFEQILSWTLFNLAGVKKINDIAFTGIINAGVIWSLMYEWLFYFLLPIISILLTRKVPPVFYLAISICFIIYICSMNVIKSQHLLSFLGGALTPFLVKYRDRNSKFNFNSIVVSVIIVALLFLLLQFRNSENVLAKLILIVIFNLIALGNNLFGVLKNSVIKLLGDISYSTYLIHGTVLFITMYFVIGLERASKLTSTEYCLTVFALTPVLVFLSFLSFIYVEKPFIEYSRKIGSKKPARLLRLTETTVG